MEEEDTLSLRANNSAQVAHRGQAERGVSIQRMLGAIPNEP